jgi:hypothetical protein
MVNTESELMDPLGYEEVRNDKHVKRVSRLEGDDAIN